ncbi:MAG: Sulfite reduction-associated complex DsrMKJOP protein DsrK (=HmeD) [uncultured Thiotrichaceae bacterium]|uniref:Sulfite reduction-associated complex DsrMKJOP protein DsrK (=HmeD) n=1 Tax=uncultured Thiotrichaceae bacterium TaxID=298394 RepID=A0A6S6U8V5_9GAMM|nr:MAG: Sulfite reduction-associated complex DsrMKJOP protein DsrK (=HmeD) [uncultured Thiotrichaceae bacterium]
MADYELPEITGEDGITDVPAVQKDVMVGPGPFVSKPDFQVGMHFPSDIEKGDDGKWSLIPNWKEEALGKLDELRGRYRSLQVYLDICVKCGACTDKCHYFIGTTDAKNMPVARQDLLRKVYRRYFTFAGKYFPKLVGATDLTEEVIDDWYNYYHQCSQCRRCSVFCPYGIDTAEISMAAREILNHVGRGQKYCTEIMGKVYKIGNNLGLPEPALADTLEGLEEDIEDETGVKVLLPLDKKGADILLITPSADFFAEPHVDGLMGYAKVFHELGLDWTLSSYASEGANFGMFIGSYENMRKISLRIRKAAEDLGVKRIVFGECGHAWRVAYSFLNTLAGPFDFLDQRYPVPQHVLEITWPAIQAGKLNIDKSRNDDMTLTFHDSCNVARATNMGDKPGGQFDIPRAVIEAVCNNYVDMPMDTIHDATFCCGGGGGLLTDDLMEVRLKGAQPRMEALKHVSDNYGVTHMAAICAICKSQFTKVLPYYGFSMDQIVSVHQLVSSALILTGQVDEEDED